MPNSISEKAQMDRALQLKKLESHLLKLVIPFIGIGHCTRGMYIKIKGSLILISSNIPHSMSRILPRKQNLLPVCLKRKLEYKWSYIEEIIDRNKINAYFNFFKRFNPLFNKVELKDEIIDDFENECNLASKEFEEAVTRVHENIIDKHQSDNE